MIRTGLDRLLDDPRGLRGRRYALLAHGASITADCRPAHLALTASEAGPPTVLFGPEHGYYAIEEDMVGSADAPDPWTGVEIRSLYGENVASLRPEPAAFAGLEVLVVDLQDVGSRYYTYAATAVWAAEVALEAGLEVWVLDRPNPLGGVMIEGNRPDPDIRSFIGAFELPVRHGLTLGELFQLEALRRGWDEAGLRIFKVSGWDRRMGWGETGRPWIAPSPNVPRVTTAYLYPGACLVEATTLSEGRGTTRPFQLVGAPGIDAPALAAALEREQIPGIRFLPTFFRPQFQKYRGAVCAGVELVLTDPWRFPAYRCGLTLLAVARRELGDRFGWRAEPYEFVADRPAIDLLTGSEEFRTLLEDGGDWRAWIDGFGEWEKTFNRRRQGVLLYR